jgi:hypothetical protein
MRLKEWLDANGKKVSTGSTGNTSSTASSGSFKKRLNKLINYYGQHLPSGIDYINVGLLTNDTLNFVEHYDTGSKAEFKIYIGPTTEAWNLKVWTDGKLTDDLSGMGWPELLKTLRAYITVPVVRTPEYSNLLTEWVDAKGKKVSISNSSSKSAGPKIPDQTTRFKSLLAQIDSDGFCKYTVNVLDSSMLSITLHNKVNVTLIRQPQSATYVLRVGNHREVYDDYEDVLRALIEEGIIGETDLCESASIAEDFKLYENLWN